MDSTKAPTTPATGPVPAAQPYGKPGFAPANLLRSATAYGLLIAQLGALLFLFEIPVWLVDRILGRKGNAFLAVQKSLLRWFFRLYPFGRIRRHNIRARTFPRPCVIVANHQSLLDVPLLLTLPARLRLMAPAWQFALPMLGEVNKLARHIEYSGRRNDPGHGAGLEALRRGESVLIFPEGRRSRRGEIRQFRDGAFELAREAGVPVVPVVLEGTGAALRKFSVSINPVRLELRALPAIDPAGKDTSTLRDETRAAMIAALAEKRGLSLPLGVAGRFAAGFAGLLVALALGVSFYVANYCIAKPPQYTGSRALADKKIVALGEARTLGENWRRERGSLNVIGLTGDPWEIGYANAKFTPEILKRQEDTLLKTIDEFVPNGLVYWALKNAIGLNNRDLPNFVSPAEQLEVLGLSEGSVDHHPGDVPLYHRILNYHAVHDISHQMIDNPLVVRREGVGCTALAAWGAASTGGEMFMARNFDFEAGEVFDRDKVVFFVWPDEGIPFCHVAWAGMAGCVSGINARGIAVTINAARTDDARGFGQIGTPVSLLVRRVLQQATTLEEAEAIIRRTPVFVSDGFLIADSRRALVIEKSPARTGRREAAKDGLLLQTNHFLSTEFAADKANLVQQEKSTTLNRMRRLEELADASFGKLDERVCLDIMRDRKVTGGMDVGLGNRNSIDAFICTHSVIMNVSRGWLWVSEGPHTLGWYRWFDVRRTLEAGPQGAVRMAWREDRDLPRDFEYYRVLDFETFRQQLKMARKGLESGDLETLKAAVMSLENVNPRAFETAYWSGRHNFARGKFKEAARDFETALERQPHYDEVRGDVKLWLQRAVDRAR